MANTQIMVVGAGVMGQGLAEAIATAGHDVLLIDQTTKLAQRGIKAISEAIAREFHSWGLSLSVK